MKKHLLNVLLIFSVVALAHTAYGLFWLVAGKTEYCIDEPRWFVLWPEFILFGAAFIASLIVLYMILFKKGYRLALIKRI